MKFVKRLLCMVLCVVTLSLSVGTKYFDTNHMENVEAVAETVVAGLSLSAMYAICYYVGTAAYANAPIEMQNLSDDEIARMGYSTISYMTAGEMMGMPVAANNPMIGFIDKAGQAYVFGANAVKAVSETSFQLIQGGKKPDDDDEDDDDEEGGIIDGLIKFPGNVKDLAGCCSIAFGSMIGAVVKDQYDKYMNGEESIYFSDSENPSNLFTSYDLAKQQSGETYLFSMQSVYESELSASCCYQSPAKYLYEIYPTSFSEPMAILYDAESYTFGTKAQSNLKDFEKCSFKGKRTCLYCGHTDSDVYFRYGSTINFTQSVPVFTNYDAFITYLKTGTGYEDAINYAQPYRIADWLQDDWAGKLLDPLTGLNALSNWANIARHQGLNALGNELDVDAFDDFLRDYFANLGTDHLPEVDPAKAPILWPSGDVEGALDPETSIDPSRNPAIQPDPSLKPNPDPGTKPDPGEKPDPDPGTDPDPGVTPLPDINMSNYQVNLKNIFPFCIPFDFIDLLRALDADPRAPCFSFPVVIQALNYREDVKLDLSIFDDAARVIRLCEKVSFILF